MEKERACYEAKQPSPREMAAEGRSGKGVGRRYDSEDWKRFVPY
jgi:hypothetical protein